MINDLRFLGGPIQFSMLIDTPATTVTVPLREWSIYTIYTNVHW